ncbi:hypothetical protein [Microbulbifer sp. TRSA005]|uniref:hypothetical protein n=1 Tax=Microbulbifer sp. TRSA005 TaxID=3243383 RepID=UPI0040399227
MSHSYFSLPTSSKMITEPALTTEPTNSDIQAAAVLNCTIAVIDNQNNVQACGVGVLVSSVCVTTKTLQADAGQPVSVTSHAIDLVA